MIILFAKSQLALFEAPVHVGAHVRKDGIVVKPHIRIQKVAVKPTAQPSLFADKPESAPHAKQSKLDTFIARHGGLDGLAKMLAGMTEGQQQQIFAGMAKLDDKTPAEMAAMFDGLKPAEPKKGETLDLFAEPNEPAPVRPPALNLPIVEHDGDTWHVLSTGTAREDGKVLAHLSSTTRGRAAKNGVQPVQMQDYLPREALGMKPDATPEIVEHVTGRGKTLRGIVRHDLTLDEAKNIDPYTFKKDGGYFIREKHLAAATSAMPATVKGSLPVAEPGAFGVPAGITKGERREINAQVVALVTEDKADYTDADRALMRQYSGNGGCGDSLNEFYTDPAVASAMWAVLGRMGVTSGSVLEPSCATGVFMHTAPAGVKVTGVEIDPISAKVAQVLHGDRHEIVNASLERFATTDGERQFDVVIGNAPFGVRGALIKDDKPGLKTAEGYFLDTALDKTRPGGIVAMIVPTGVLDAKSNRALRERLLRKGEFLGAVRMPNTAFEHSHTEVTTDIVFFRKRPDDVAGALMTVPQDTLKALGVWDDEYLSGAYFSGRGASSIFGTMEAGWRAKAGIGQDITVSGSMQGVPDEISRWTPDEAVSATPDVHAILDALGDDETAKKKALGGAVMRAYQTGKAGDTKVVDGVTYILQGRPLRWHRIDEFLADPAVREALDISADIERLFSGQAVDRPTLEERVRAWVAQHGNPGKNTNLQLAASQDKTLYRLIGAVSADGSLSDAVTGRAARRVEGTLDTAAQSLAVEHASGTFSPADLAARIGKDADEVEDALFASPSYAYAGEGQWTTMDQYLTGELWPKLDRVREEIARGDLRDGVAEKYALQAKRLEEVIDPKSLEDVEVLINSAFLPTDVLAAYFNERKNASDNEWTRQQPDISITYADGIYSIKGGNQYGDAGLLDKYLNRTGVRKDDLPTIDRWNEDFKVWLLSSRYRDQVEDLYNRKFRGFVQREFSNAPIDIPGLNDEGLKDYQYGGLRWALAAGKGIIAADVGLGKTVRGLMLARMAKMNGTANKPTFVVPKSVLANWMAEAEKWFPGSRVLVIGETYTRDKAGNLKSKPDTAAERNRKLHELTQNDYDFVFISQPSFNDIDLDPITKEKYVGEDFWVQRGEKLGNAGDKRRRKVREAYEQAIADRDFRKRTDAIYFNDLGVDMLLVDEGHCFPAGTLIDGRPIESYNEGDAVRAFDHRSGKVVKGCVANLQVRRPASLYRVHLSDGTAITCTGKHPFFTQRGYVFAENLQSGDVAFKNLYNCKNENERISLEKGCSAIGYGGLEMQSLPSRVQTQQSAGLASPGTWAVAVLLRKVMRHAVEACQHLIAGGHRGSEPSSERRIQAGIYGARFESQPDARSSDSGEGQRDLEKENVSSRCSWRERLRSYRSSVFSGDVAGRGLGNGISDSWSSSFEWSEDLLDGGYRTCGLQDSYRSGRQEPRFETSATDRSLQGKDLIELGVDRVEVFQRTSDGTFGGMCPGGLVYNIEVEQYHNYFAEDVLVHNSFKNLYAARNRFGESPKFLGGQGLSNRALDMNLKTRWVREQNGGNGIYMLTATPTKNSPLEIYSMLSHIAPEAFERIGIRNSEEFLDRFCEFANDKILGTDGTIQDALVTVGFKNLGELREIMRRYIDRKTAADVGLVLPERDDRMHMIDMTPAQQSVYADLRAQMAELATKKDATGDAHIFSIMDKMAKAAMDLELLGAPYAGEHSPKYADAAKHISAGAKDGGQVVFSESVATHEKIAAALVQAGIPREQIAIINAQAADSSAKRQNISDAFNAGKLKVVIGNKTMEEGVNLQKKTTDIHHLDLPWEPASMQQRNGRGLRQGNINEAVRLHTYISKGSFDGYRYQSMMAKKDWQDVLWNGGDRVDNMAREGRFDRSDMMIMMSADPEAERAKFEADKAAAQERYDGEQRRAAASEFVRFQIMKRSYRDLQNKKTVSADRLRSKIDRAKTLLSNNKHFSAKGALDSEQPVVIHPDTGIVLQRGTGLDVAETDGDTVKWVVTDVNPTTGDVSMRRYGELGKNAKAITVPSSKLEHGVTTFKFDEAAEAAHVAQKLEAAGAEKANNLESWEDVQSLPPSILAANHDAIQRQIKEGAKSYKFHMPYGDVPMVHRETGEPSVAASYEHTKLHDTHDYLLPTEANREKAIQAYIADQQARTFGTDYTTKKRGRSEARFVEKYPGKYGQRHNRWAAAGKMAFGDGFEKEARDAFSRVQGERIRRAPDFADALREAAPMAEFNYSEVPKWPRKALATLFAKAKHDGALEKPFESEQPKTESYGRKVNALPIQLWTYRRGGQVENAVNGGYSNDGYSSGTVRDTLIKLAENNGYHDLAAAMMVSSGKDPEATVRELLRLPVMSNDDVAEAVRHVIAKHPELGDKTMKDLGPSYAPHIPIQVQGMTIADALRREAA